MIKQYDIDKVLDAANIVDVVSDFVQLKAAGANLKGLCPFHDDSNPSFMVSPAKNICKCFVCGEGGGPVNFIMAHEGMSFPEAIKYLAKKYGIKIEEKEPTADELLEYRQKEAMYIANDLLNKEFQQQLLSHKEAQDYAYKRWDKRYCDEVGVGYCPPHAFLAQKLGISKEVAEKLRLVNDKGSDFFYGRITIPICDQQNRVIGFTARILNDSRKDGKECKAPKYLNSADSLLYNKSRSVFGINTAYKEAARSKAYYLVEGAPDCMRLQSIGVHNTVATLGTAWTEEHFRQLKRAASHLCFLPDADPPKPNERYGPGIKAVMKAGEAAMRLGFSVSVKQIPVSEKKQDPDTFFRSKNIFASIEEEDFILWVADLLFEPGMTTEQQGKVIKQLASLMALINDETTIEMYVSQLTKFVPGKRMWVKAIEKQRNEKAEAEALAKAEKESDLFKQFGFNVEKDKYYYSISEKGGVYEWSNFTMQPLFHIKDSVNPKRLYMLKNEFGLEELVELKQEDLVSLQKFMVRIEGLGNFIWKASQRELNKLKSYLYEKTETAEEIRQLGWQRHGFFAFGNGIYCDGKFLKVDDYGIVRIEDKGNFYLPANSKIYRSDTKLFQFERRFVHLGLSTIGLRQFSEQVFKVFGNNGRVGFMFLLATLFRDIVTRVTRSFPILNLFGPKGSGKSELGHTLMSFFIIENVPPNIQNSTLPALNDTVAAVSDALVHIDEFKNSLVESQLPPFNINGKQYGIPWSMDGKAFFYNKDVFDELGLTIPTTLTELYELCEALKAAGYEEPISAGFSAPWAVSHYLGTICQRVVDPETLAKDYAGEGDFTDPGYIEALNIFKKLGEYMTKDPNSVDHEFARNAFIFGESPMVYLQLGECKYLRDDVDFEYSFFNFPAVEGGKGDPGQLTGAPEGMMISNVASPEVQAAAVKFVKFVISQHGGYEMTKQTGELSCVKGALDETNLDAKQLEAVELILNSTQPALWQDNVTDAVIADAFMAGGQLIMTGDKTAEDVMKDVQTAAASIK